MTEHSDTDRWLMLVAGVGGGSTPYLLIQPRPAGYDAAADRLLSGGWDYVTREDWDHGTAPTTPAGTIEVSDGVLVAVSTGAATLYAAEHLPVSPMWTSAALERLGTVVLLPAGTFTAASYAAGDVLRTLGDLADARQLIAGSAAATFAVADLH